MKLWSAQLVLAVVVLGVGLLGLFGVAAVAIAADDQPGEAAQAVFTAVLPVLGTWVGTILAFYFARENLNAASRTTIEALQAAGSLGTSERAASELMIPLDSIKPVARVADAAAGRALPLAELLERMRTQDQNRVPVLLESTTAPLFVVHRPDLAELAQQREVGLAALPAGLTVADLLADERIGRSVRNLATVGRQATLAEARAAMRGLEDCKDVFVTEDGTDHGAVVGWITNSLLAKEG